MGLILWRTLLLQYFLFQQKKWDFCLLFHNAHLIVAPDYFFGAFNIPFKVFTVLLIESSSSVVLIDPSVAGSEFSFCWFRFWVEVSVLSWSYWCYSVLHSISRIICDSLTITRLYYNSHRTFYTRLISYLALFFRTIINNNRKSGPRRTTWLLSVRAQRLSDGRAIAKDLT